MRWTTKHFWVVALGAGLIVGPAWAQSSRQSDEDSSSTRSSRQYDDDDSDSYSSSSSRSDRSSRTGSSDSDYGQGRSMRSNQSQRSGSQASSRMNRDDDNWSWDDSDRSNTDRSTSRSPSRTNRQNNQSDDSWFGFDSGNQRSSRSTRDEGQWSNWDSETDIREAGVWRVGNLLGKEVRNSQGEDLGAIEDIVIDLNNRNIRYVAISHGGMLGVGEKLFAVPLSDLREQQDEDGNTVFVLNVDARALENAQGFENRDRWPAQADTSFRTRSTQTASRQSASSRESGQMASRSGQQSRSFQGEFEEFDEDANQITVRTSDGRRRVYNVSPSVRVTHQGRRAFLDELEEGDQISLSYTTSGDNRTLITSISDASRQASRGTANRSTRSGDSESYRLGSYDPQDDYRDGSRQSSQRQRDQQRRTSSSSLYDSDDSDDDWNDDSSTRSRSSDRSSSQRNRSSDDSSSYDDDDQSSSRSTSSSRSQDDSDSYDSYDE